MHSLEHSQLMNTWVSHEHQLRLFWSSCLTFDVAAVQMRLQIVDLLEHGCLRTQEILLCGTNSVSVTKYCSLADSGITSSKSCLSRLEHFCSAHCTSFAFRNGLSCQSGMHLKNYCHMHFPPCWSNLTLLWDKPHWDLACHFQRGPTAIHFTQRALNRFSFWVRNGELKKTQFKNSVWVSYLLPYIAKRKHQN